MIWQDAVKYTLARIDRALDLYERSVKLAETHFEVSQDFARRREELDARAVEAQELAAKGEVNVRGDFTARHAPSPQTSTPPEEKR